MNTQVARQEYPQYLKSLRCPLDSNCFFSFTCMSNSSERNALMPVRLSFNKGDLLFKGMGDEESAYVILSGIAGAICYLSSSEVVTICLLGKSYTIGEIEAFFQQKIYYVIQALTPMTVCQLNTRGLVQHVDENPVLLRHVFSAIENNTQAFARQLWVMNAQRIHERIKRFLSIFVKLSGSEWEETRVDLTHEELATLINTDRVSITRVLHKLEKEGFVKLGYDHLWVVGPLPTEELDSTFRFDPLDRNISLLASDHFRRRIN
jgi:CRP-like cAMP-binding protein